MNTSKLEIQKVRQETVQKERERELLNERIKESDVQREKLQQQIDNILTKNQGEIIFCLLLVELKRIVKYFICGQKNLTFWI